MQAHNLDYASTDLLALVNNNMLTQYGSCNNKNALSLFTAAQIITLIMQVANFV